MDIFKILFCIHVDGDIRSIYALTESDFILMNPDEHDTMEDNDLLKSTVNTNVNASNTECAASMWFNVNILEIKPFLKLLESSYYRKSLYYSCKNSAEKCSKTVNDELIPLCNKFVTVINAELNDSYIIDYAWGWRLCRDCHIGLERECAAAWLSTLGGAFSALGDYDNKFASMAFYTSMQQIRLARMSEDENGLARGWLFLALALSQLGFNKYPKILLRRAWEFKSIDSRHRNMCLGVEAKLNYDRKQRRLNKQSENRGKDLKLDQRRAMLEMFKTLKM